MNTDTQTDFSAKFDGEDDQAKQAFQESPYYGQIVMQLELAHQEGLIVAFSVDGESRPSDV